MRTYTRKKTQVQVIENVQSRCRLCLEKSEEMISIFDENVNEVYSCLALRIVMCLGLEVSRDDALPKCICKLCCSELEKFYSFKNNCTATYQKLKASILATRNIDIKKRDDESNEQKASDLTVFHNNGKETESELFNLPLNAIQNETLIEPITCKSPLVEENIISDDKSSTKVSELIKEKDCNVKAGFLSVQVTPDVETDQVLVVDNLSDKVDGIGDAGQAQKEKTGITKTPECLPAYIVNSLIENGVLAKRDDKLELLDQNNITFHLETAYGSEVVMELVEEELEQPLDVTGKRSGSKILNSNWKSDARCCGTCGARFSSRGALVRHLRVHSGERPFACRTCGRRFSQREVMRRHELLHADKLPYQCARCPKSYTQRGALEAHGRSHAPPGARPLQLHRCCRCPKVFLYPSGLSRHMSVHQGRDYPCDECSRTFNDKSSLQRHKRGHQRTRAS